MILQALADYEKRYEKFHDDVKKGCEKKDFKFFIEIEEDGSFVQLTDLREGKKGKSYLVSQAVARSGKKAYEKPNILWDDVKNVLGYHKPEKTEAKNKKEDENCELKLEYFVKKVKEISDIVKDKKTVEAISAVERFYENGEREEVQQDPLWKDCINQNGCNVAFRISGQRNPVAAMPEILELAADLQDAGSNDVNSVCLVTGKKGATVRIHPETPILGGSPKGKLLGFQKSSGYDSYYKEQGYNAPVSEEGARLYSTGLNRLLHSDNNHSFLLGDSYVFWSLPADNEKDIVVGEINKAPNKIKGNSLERNMQFIFSGVPAEIREKKKTDPDKGIEAVKAYMDQLKRGLESADGNGRFCLLGLSPNQARISVKLWKQGSIDEFRNNLNKHFADSEIKNSFGEKKKFSIYQILSAIGVNGKTDKLPPFFGSAYLAAIISGGIYPMSVYQNAIIRLRAERKVTDSKAFILRGSLNRWAEHNMYKLGKEHFEMSLDEKNVNPGYIAGRLFATFEKIQTDALGTKLNKTVGETYYGAASTMPGVVLPILLRKSRFHLQKLSQGQRIYYDRLIGSIMSNIAEMPSRLTLIEQGAFGLGYYHQRQDFYTKKNENEVED